MGQRENAKRWRDKNKEWIKQFEKKDKLKRLTRQKARRRIIIPFKTKCAICKKNFATQRHHPDYSKPLEVLFVCAKCNQRI